MSARPASDSEKIKAGIAEQVRSGQVRLTLHSHQEMVVDNFLLEDVLTALLHSELLENYPDHKRGACALVGGVAPDGRPIHIVCTTAHPMLILITVYEPKPPKWLTPTQRNR